MIRFWLNLAATNTEVGVYYTQEFFSEILNLKVRGACSTQIIMGHVLSQFYRVIGLMSRMFVNGPRDQGSIPSRVIPKTQRKWYLMPPCLTLSIIR